MKKTIKNSLFLIKEIYRADRWRIPYSFFNAVFTAIIQVFFYVYIVKYIVNNVFLFQNFREIVKIILVGIVAYILSIAISSYYSVYARISNQKIYAYFLAQTTQKASSILLSEYDNPEFYNQHTKALEEISTRFEEFIFSNEILLKCIVTILSISFMVIWDEPMLIFFLIIPFLIRILAGKKTNQIKYQKSMKELEERRTIDFVKRSFYLKDYAKAIRMDNIPAVLTDRFHKSVEKIKAIYEKNNKKLAVLSCIQMFFDEVFTLIVPMIYAVYKTVVKKTMVIGDCFIIINSMTICTDAIIEMVAILLDYHRINLFTDNLFLFLSQKKDIKFGERKLEQIYSLEFSHVSFGYVSNQMILKDISFQIQKGEKIALVGDNGAGKTTLIQLLLGVYLPTEGEIKVNGHPLDNYRAGEITKAFGVLQQNFHIYATSVICNMLRSLPREEQDYNKCWDALSLCGLKEKICDFSNGLDTVMTREFESNGKIFSPEKKQKLGIAGMLAQEKDVYIFDEPTSSLDPIAECKIIEDLFCTLAKKTVLFISHRLSFAAKADRIFVLQNGKIQECGSHNELLLKDGIYAQMWKKQASNYL